MFLPAPQSDAKRNQDQRNSCEVICFQVNPSEIMELHGNANGLMEISMNSHELALISMELHEIREAQGCDGGIRGGTREERNAWNYIAFSWNLWSTRKNVLGTSCAPVF